MRRLWFVVLLAACGRYEFGRADAPMSGSDADAPIDTPASALVFYCPFDEATGPYTCGTLIASCNNRCPTTVASPHGSGLGFDGGEDVQLGTTALSGSYTVSVWFRVDMTVAGGLVARPFDSTTQLDSFGLFVSDSTGRLFYETTDGVATHYVTGGLADLRDGTWHQAAASWDGTTQSLYLDGALLASGTMPASASVFPLYVGGDRDMGAPGFRLTGAVDELRVYSRALSAPEIAALAQ